MSIERNMIGLSAQAHFVPRYRLTTVSGAPPPLLSGPRTNRKKYEFENQQTRHAEIQITLKAEHTNRMGTAGFHTRWIREAERDRLSSITGSAQKISSQGSFRFPPADSTSQSMHSGQVSYSKLHPKKDCSPGIHLSRQRWQYSTSSPPRPPGNCVWTRSLNPILKINTTKQSESHPTGFFVGKQREKFSPSFQTKPRAHLLHRTIERYHE